MTYDYRYHQYVPPPPTVNNMQAKPAVALGYAGYDEKRSQIGLYISYVADSGIAAKSIWAGLVTNSKGRTYVKPWTWDTVRFLKGAKKIEGALPNTIAQHWIVYDADPSFVWVADPRGIAAEGDERKKLQDELYWDLCRKIIASLNMLETHFPWPTEPETTVLEWGQRIVKNAPRNLLKSIESYGDCLHAYRIQNPNGWVEFGRSMLRQRIFIIPKQPLVELPAAA